MNVWLVIPDRTGAQLGPLQLPVTAGRSAGADVRLNDRWVSRHHCRLDLVDEQIVVRDLGSKHGTYVNRQRIVEPVELNPGDELGVGLTTFLVYWNRTHQFPPVQAAEALEQQAVSA